MKERRNFPVTELRIENRDDQTEVVGHAAVFNSLSEDLGGFREQVEPGAFDDVLQDDVRALLNHDPNLILARTKSGTLRLAVTDKGLEYRFTPPETTTGKDLLISLQRGDIDQSSFGFRVKEDVWEERDGEIHRRIIKFERLFDVSPVTYPAYPDTDVAKRELRSFLDTKEEIKEKETEKSQPVASNGLRLQLRRIKNRKQANKLNEVNQ